MLSMNRKLWRVICCHWWWQGVIMTLSSIALFVSYSISNEIGIWLLRYVTFLLLCQFHFMHTEFLELSCVVLLVCSHMTAAVKNLSLRIYYQDQENVVNMLVLFADSTNLVCYTWKWREILKRVLLLMFHFLAYQSKVIFTVYLSLLKVFIISKTLFVIRKDEFVLDCIGKRTLNIQKMEFKL